MSKTKEFAAVALDHAFASKGVTHEELAEAAKIAGEIRKAFDDVAHELKPTETQATIAKRILRRCIKDRAGIIPKGCRLAIKLAIQYEPLLDAQDPPAGEPDPAAPPEKESAIIE